MAEAWVATLAADLSVLDVRKSQVECEVRVDDQSLLSIATFSFFLLLLDTIHNVTTKFITKSITAKVYEMSHN